VASLGQQQTVLLKTQQQVSTGRRIQTASDDPVAAARAVSVNQADAMNTQYAGNRSAARNTLSLAESNLQSVTSLLHDVHTTTVNAGNGSLTAADRRTMATELSGRLQELVGLANSTDGAGNYLFSGFQSKTQPFVDVAGVTSYNGDDGQRLVQANAGRQISSSDSGADMFMRIKNGNGTLLAQASAANTGGGIISSAAVINPALLTGNSYTIAYNGPTATPAAGNTGTGTISTPTVINQAAVTSKDYSVAFTVAGPVTTYDVTELSVGSNTQAITSLNFTVPGTFRVDAAVENDLVTLTGVYANEAALVAKIQADLDVDLPGTFTVTSTGSVAAANFAVSIARVAAGTGSTAVTVSAVGGTANGIVNSAGVAGGASVLAGQPYVSGQTISFGGMQFNVQGVPSNADNFTVLSPGYKVTNTTTAAVVLPVPPVTGRVPYVSGQAISFDGMQLSVQGTMTSGDSFTVSSSTNESIFKTISDLITALNGTVVGASLTNSLNRGLNHLDNALNNVLTTQSSLGLRLQEIDALQTAGEDLGLQYKQTLSELQDADPFKAYSDLTQQNAALQASLKSFAAVSNLSLFSYM
jgi:flagellar hook-associated protein 3 FlgL